MLRYNELAMTGPLRILIVEDNPDDAELVVHRLRQAGLDFAWQRVEDETAYLAALERGPDLILADYHLPRFNALRALSLLQERGIDIPLIVVTGAVGEEAAVECMRRGAADYLLKDRLARLGPAVRSAVERHRLRVEKQRTEQRLRELERIVRRSPAVVFLWRAAEGWPVEYVSDNVQQFGYTPEDFYAGRVTYSEIVHPDDLDRVAAEVARYSQEADRQEFQQTYRIITTRGETRWVDDYTWIRRDEEGRVTHYQGIVIDVTDRREAEERLRESEERLRSVVEHSHAGILIVDDSYRFVYVNDELCRILGYEREEILGQDFRKFLDEESRSLVAERYVQRQRGEAPPARYEFNVVRKDGMKRRVEIRAAVIRDPEGRMRTVGQLLDITERKRAEEAVARYIDRLQVLREIDQAILAARSPGEIAMAALDHVRRLLPCSRASVTTFDLLNRRATVLAVHVNGTTRLAAGSTFPLDRFGVIRRLEQGQVHLVKDTWQVKGLDSTGQTLLAEGIRSYLIVPLVSRGTLVGSLNVGAYEPDAFDAEHVEVAREVADQLAIAIQNAWLLEAERQRRAELEALREASLHLTSSLQPQPVLEAVVEHALKLVAASDAHIFLYDGERLTFGAAVWAGGLQQTPYAEPRPDGVTYAVARTGEQIVIPDVDSHPLFADWKWGGAIVGLPLRSGERVVGVMTVAFERPHEFTPEELRALSLLADQASIAIQNARLHQEVRRHAEELSEALARLQELDQLKSEFIRNVSHELRLPLALIRGYADLLAMGELGEVAPEQKKPIEIIARRAQMLGQLVEDITLILGAEARPIKREPVRMDDLARAALDDFAIAAEAAGLTLQSQIDDGLPPVLGEPIYLRRVLDNLLNNAVKFTPAGGTIVLRLTAEPDEVILQVSDTGIGIPPEHQQRIFDRFYQVDGSTSRRYGGMGLGLALVKEVVEALNGTVGVESVEGKGSTFTVRLPVARSPTSDAPGSTPTGTHPLPQ